MGEPLLAWVRKAGLEWLYRLTGEPKRLWRRWPSPPPPRFVWLLNDAIVRR